ncbi:MAG: hypothetical protein E7104_06005 [Prevotella sp.]|nr:hypothetical protein [Prevotella sp.]
MRKDIAPSTREFFVRGMEGHSAVMCIKHLEGDVYLIERTNGRPDLKVLIADIYIAGEGDIIEITYDYSDIDCIVLVGFYNRYSRAAKAFAKEKNIALYDNREFFGAVNCTGYSFLNYERKTK